MQVKAVAFHIHPPTSSREELHPSLKIWQSLYYELIAAGYRKQEIATWMDLTPRSVDRLLTGSTQQPSFKVLSRMLQAYCNHALRINGQSGGEQ